MGVPTCPVVERGGLKIYTTLDYKVQKLAEKWVQAAATVPQAKDPAAAAKKLGLTLQPWMQNLVGRNVHNGALAAVDYQTGEVIAYVGSANYYATKATPQFQPQFDVLSDGWRQVGSSFKPFNYVTGINDGTMTAATMFMDVTTDFGGGYTPTDADLEERGPVRMRQALQFSLNIPAVKAVAINGVDHVFNMAEKFGLQFQTQTPTAGLSLTLGTEVIHPVDLATGYATMADGGRYLGRTTILRVVGPDGKDVITPYTPPAGEQVVDPRAAYIITDILKGNTNPAVNPYWGVFKVTDASGKLRPATLKTGTNNDTNDLIAAGYIAPPDAAGKGRRRVCPGGGRLERQQRQQSGEHASVAARVPRRPDVRLAGLHGRRHADVADPGLHRAGRDHDHVRGRLQRPAARSLHHQDGPRALHRRDAAHAGRQPAAAAAGGPGSDVHQGRLPPLAAGLRHDPGAPDARLPGLLQRGDELPELACGGPGVGGTGDEGRRGLRWARAHPHHLLLQPGVPAIRPDLGRAVPAAKTCARLPPTPSLFPGSPAPGSSFGPGSSSGPGQPTVPAAVVPDVVGRPVQVASQALVASGFVPVIVGNGRTVVAQSPAGGSPATLGSQVVLQT